MRKELKMFAQCMEHKLKLNDHKGGWENSSNESLLEKLRREVDELEQALREEPDLNIMFECADIANFAMMIAWNSAHAMLRGAGDAAQLVNLRCQECGEYTCKSGCPNEIPF